MPISNGASPIASALGIRLGATPREHIHPNSQLRRHPTKPDISTLLGLGHFYFALTVVNFATPEFCSLISDSSANLYFPMSGVIAAGCMV